jgi:hypothetical protein
MTGRCAPTRANTSLSDGTPAPVRRAQFAMTFATAGISVVFLDEVEARIEGQKR